MVSLNTVGVVYRRVVYIHAFSETVHAIGTRSIRTGKDDARFRFPSEKRRRAALSVQHVQLYEAADFQKQNGGVKRTHARCRVTLIIGPKKNYAATTVNLFASGKQLNRRCVLHYIARKNKILAIRWI